MGVVLNHVKSSDIKSFTSFCHNALLLPHWKVYLGIRNLTCSFVVQDNWMISVLVATSVILLSENVLSSLNINYGSHAWPREGVLSSQGKFWFVSNGVGSFQGHTQAKAKEWSVIWQENIKKQLRLVNSNIMKQLIFRKQAIALGSLDTGHYGLNQVTVLLHWSVTWCCFNCLIFKIL